MGTIKEEIKFTSFKTQDTITARIWKPRDEIKAILQVCHGMCEYIDRYEDFAKYLNQRGILVCGDDHLGHGLTVKNKDDYGYFGKIDGDKCLVENEELLKNIMQQKYDVPYFLLGHSLGSFITRHFVSKYGKNLNGYICCGTSGPRWSVNIGLVVAKIQQKIFGERHRSQLLRNLSFFGYNKNFDKKEGKSAWLNTDTQAIKKYVNDEKCRFIFTSSAYEDMFKLMIHATKKKTFENTPKQLPILIISGEKDPLGKYGKGVKQVYNIYKRAEVKDLQLKIYKNARHEILNEKCKNTVYNDIYNWMRNRM